MINKLVKLLTLITLPLSFVSCTKTYDINFTNEDRLGGEWEVQAKYTIVDNTTTGLFHTFTNNYESDITFIQKDLRESTDEKPVAEFIIKKVSYKRNGKDMDLTHLIGKKIVGRNIGNAEYEFTCEGKPMDYSEFHLLSDPGGLVDTETNYLTQFNRKNVKIGDEWELDKVAVADSYKVFNMATKLEKY